MSAFVAPPKFDEPLAELRRESLQAISALLGVCAWLGLAWALWPVLREDPLRIQLRPMLLLLLAAAAAGYGLRSRLALASGLLLTGLVVAVIGIVSVFRSVETLQLFAAPIIFGSILLGERAVALTMLSVAAFIAYGASHLLGVPASALVLPSVLLGLIAAAMIISTRNLYIALHWTFHNFETAVRNQNRARDRQAELGRVLKSLESSAGELQRMNYALQLAQRRAEESRQLKQQFAQTISHELRTPLNLITGFAEAMIKTPEYYADPLPPQYMRDLTIIYRNANHLQNLVNDVLDMARIEAAQMVLQLEPVDMSSFLTEIVNMASSMVEAQRLTFRAQVAPDLPASLWMDSVRIKQVLYNLLNNAVRFTPHGSVTLRVAREADAVCFAVADTGIGIAPEHHQMIFEPFRQVESPMRRRVGGVGLGLPISRQLVALHGGALDLVSATGQGSTFHFRIPIGLMPSAPRSESDSGTTRSSEQRQDNLLLLITESPATAVLISRHLSAYRVVVVGDLSQAEVALRSNSPQAVIVDTSVAALAGIDLTALATRWAQGPTVFIACALSGESSQRLAADSILVKPISRETLWDTLRQFGTGIERILIVDDDRDFVRLVERMLTTSLKRFQATSAHSGEEALAMLAFQRPDLILLDLQMPDLNGFQVLDRIRANPTWQDIPVVIVSAQGELDTLATTMGTLQVALSTGYTQTDLLKWMRGILA